MMQIVFLPVHFYFLLDLCKRYSKINIIRSIKKYPNNQFYLKTLSHTFFAKYYTEIIWMIWLWLRLWSQHYLNCVKLHKQNTIKYWSTTAEAFFNSVPAVTYLYNETIGFKYFLTQTLYLMNMVSWLGLNEIQVFC